MLLALALLLAPVTFAQDVPLRPVTYNLDPKLSAGPIANLLELYVDPESFVRDLKAAKPPAPPEPVPTPAVEGAPPVGPDGQPALPAIQTTVFTPPAGHLLLLNDRGSWADVTVNGTKIGKIGPYIYGVISPAPAGTYAVTFTYANGFVHADEVETTYGAIPGAFGGPPSTLPMPDGKHTTKLRTK